MRCFLLNVQRVERFADWPAHLLPSAVPVAPEDLLVGKQYLRPIHRAVAFGEGDALANRRRAESWLAARYSSEEPRLIQASLDCLRGDVEAQRPADRSWRRERLDARGEGDLRVLLLSRRAWPPAARTAAGTSQWLDSGPPLMRQCEVLQPTRREMEASE